jgi:prefoldin subunit 5
MANFLAGIFVSLVMAANTLAPQANLPKVLGTEDEATSSAVTDRIQKRSEALEAAREKRLQALQRAKDAREQFKQRLETIKDERKQKVVENLDERIASQNQKWVEHWNNVLGRLTELVVKIEKDISSVTTAVSQANAAIATAQSAVTIQAGKTYIIDITTEDNLGQAVRTTIAQFHSDVKAVIETIRSARLAVQDAFQALRSLHTEVGNE